MKIAQKVFSCYIIHHNKRLQWQQYAKMCVSFMSSLLNAATWCVTT